jgi:tRNA dimethylallyltransferase
MGEGPRPGDVPPLLVIAGATATGKTALAIEVALALRLRGVPAEVISADSRQVYRGLDIGTAKPTPAERRGVPHHGLDLVDPDRRFSVADFTDHVAGVLPTIGAAGGLAILAGGTGFYLRAVAGGLDTRALPSDPAVRARVEARLRDEGLEAATGRLRRLAPDLARRIDLRNPRRVARALEIAELQGDRPLPAARGYPGPVAWLGLRPEPEEHRRWIERRARGQFEAGLIEEARSLRARFDRGLPAFSAIGYREAWSVLDGERSLEAAVALDVRRNLQFAKRQATWFRAEPAIRWLAAAPQPLAAAVEVAAELMARPGAPASPAG